MSVYVKFNKDVPFGTVGGSVSITKNDDPVKMGSGTDGLINIGFVTKATPITTIAATTAAKP